MFLIDPASIQSFALLKKEDKIAFCCSCVSCLLQSSAPLTLPFPEAQHLSQSSPRDVLPSESNLFGTHRV